MPSTRVVPKYANSVSHILSFMFVVDFDVNDFFHLCVIYAHQPTVSTCFTLVKSVVIGFSFVRVERMIAGLIFFLLRFIFLGHAHVISSCIIIIFFEPSVGVPEGRYIIIVVSITSAILHFDILYNPLAFI